MKFHIIFVVILSFALSACGNVTSILPTPPVQKTATNTPVDKVQTKTINTHSLGAEVKKPEYQSCQAKGLSVCKNTKNPNGCASAVSVACSKAVIQTTACEEIGELRAKTACKSGIIYLVAAATADPNTCTTAEVQTRNDCLLRSAIEIPAIYPDESKAAFCKALPKESVESCLRLIITDRSPRGKK